MPDAFEMATDLAIFILCLIAIYLDFLGQSIARLLSNHIKADIERHRYVTDQIDRMQTEIRLLAIRLEDDRGSVDSPEESSID